MEGIWNEDKKDRVGTNEFNDRQGFKGLVLFICEEAEATSDEVINGLHNRVKRERIEENEHSRSAFNSL